MADGGNVRTSRTGHSTQRAEDIEPFFDPIRVSRPSLSGLWPMTHTSYGEEPQSVLNDQSSFENFESMGPLLQAHKAATPRAARAQEHIRAGGDEMTQRAIDEVRDPGMAQKIIEWMIGTSPSMGLVSAATTTPQNAFNMNPMKWGVEKMPQGAKGWFPGRGMGALAMLLHAKEAGAPTLGDDYESHGQWQPFRGLR